MGVGGWVGVCVCVAPPLLRVNLRVVSVVGVWVLVPFIQTVGLDSCSS